MITLISVKGFDYEDLKTLMENNALPSINEYMELHQVISSPPFIYPFSLIPMLTGLYQANLNFNTTGHKTLYNFFHKHYSHKPGRMDSLKSFAIREPIFSDRHTWQKAEVELMKRHPDFFTLTLETPELFRTLKKKASLDQRTSGYVHIDYIVHRLYNIIGGHGSNLIIIAGAGKSVKESKLKYLKILHRKKIISKKPVNAAPGIIFVEIPDSKDLKDELHSNVLNINKADFIAYKEQNGFGVQFNKGMTKVRISDNQRIFEIEHIGDSPLYALPNRIARSEFYTFSSGTDYPMFILHLEKMFKHSNFNTIIGRDVFSRENLVQPVLINRRWKKIFQSTDIFAEILHEIGSSKYLERNDLDITSTSQFI